MSEILSTIGRRKNAIARLQMREGSGQITVNKLPYNEYFPTLSLQNTFLLPLQLTNLQSKYDLNINTAGGGLVGQAGAIRLAIARALVKIDAELRAGLKEKGLMRRDPRMKERKKPGQPGARKRFQFSKR
ncbi:MAG: 30S ribosomal protein S9 [Verrucomicrobiales bacterium]|jgi:small subunit ribosomal protein S9|nr:30S ribosomal protein S9 [Verrucomicrobiales bacterium]MDB4467767.1 30S ribosomal protein S9 [Verrucomicrobiales bacterium]MDB4527228.1 30S ribosomal protein S9 [bacterium]MDF1787132.1 30S ribosomal protein S9 [Verrucomicrobiales bacterium]